MIRQSWSGEGGRAVGEKRGKAKIKVAVKQTGRDSCGGLVFK